MPAKPKVGNKSSLPAESKTVQIVWGRVCDDGDDSHGSLLLSTNRILPSTGVMTGDVAPIYSTATSMSRSPGSKESKEWLTKIVYLGSPWVIFFTFSSGFRILVRMKLLLSQRETNTGSQLFSVRSHRELQCCKFNIVSSGGSRISRGEPTYYLAKFLVNERNWTERGVSP